jgi:hypothetical protein
MCTTSGACFLLRAPMATLSVSGRSRSWRQEADRFLLARALGVGELALDGLLTVFARAVFGALKPVRPLDKLTVPSD